MFCLRPKRHERDELDVGLQCRDHSTSVLSLGAPAADKSTEDMLSQVRVREKVRDLTKPRRDEVEAESARLEAERARLSVSE